MICSKKTMWIIFLLPFSGVFLLMNYRLIYILMKKL